MDHHSADHQDPPGGGGGGNPSQGGANQNIRQPGNLKDHNAYDDSRRPNVSADRGGVNTSGTVISANVTDSVTNGTNPQGITDNINRVLNSPGMQKIRGAIGNVANVFSATSSVDPQEYHGRTFQPPQPQDDENKVNLVSDRLAGDPPRTPSGTVSLPILSKGELQLFRQMGPDPVPNKQSD